MADSIFRNIITVLDRASEPIRAINSRIMSLGAPVRHFAAGLSEVGATAGFPQVIAQAENTGAALGRMRGQVMGLLGPLAALGAAGSIAGLAEMAKHAAGFGAQLFDASKKIGISGQSLAAYHYAAQLAGVATETVDVSMSRLNRNMALAAGGKNKEV